MEYCLGSFYLSFFIAYLLHNILFLVGLRYSEGSIKALLTVTVLFDLSILFTLPLLLIMTEGVCV